MKNKKKTKPPAKRGQIIFGILGISTVTGLVFLFIELMRKINLELANNQAKAANGLIEAATPKSMAIAPFSALIFIVIVTMITTAAFALRAPPKQEAEINQFSDFPRSPK